MERSHVVGVATVKAMTIPLPSIVLSYLWLSLCFTLAFATRHGQPKSLHFSLYEQETLNKTGYVIVLGVDTGTVMDKDRSPFGTLFAFQDPLTSNVNRSSKVIGVAEGASITSSVDGLHCLNIVKISLSLKKYKGSISVLGVTHNLEPRDLPVVGGTDDFLFVQGYVTSSPVPGLFLVYKIDFHLYWPPYATYLTTPKSSLSL